MKLNADSRLFRYAFLLSDQKRHIQSTSLSGMFWRCVLTTFAVTVPIGLILIYLFNLIFNFYATIVPTLALIVLIGIIIGYGCLADWADRQQARKRDAEWRRQYDPEYMEPAQGLIATVFFAIKHRVCPIVQIER